MYTLEQLCIDVAPTFYHILPPWQIWDAAESFFVFVIMCLSVACFWSRKEIAAPRTGVVHDLYVNKT